MAEELPAQPVSPLGSKSRSASGGLPSCNGVPGASGLSPTRLVLLRAPDASIARNNSNSVAAARGGARASSGACGSAGQNTERPLHVGMGICAASDKLTPRPDNCNAAAARGNSRATAAILDSKCTRRSARALGTGTAVLGAVACTTDSTVGPSRSAAASAAPQKREFSLTTAAGGASV